MSFSPTSLFSLMESVRSLDSPVSEGMAEDDTATSHETTFEKPESRWTLLWQKFYMMFMAIFRTDQAYKINARLHAFHLNPWCSMYNICSFNKSWTHNAVKQWCRVVIWSDSGAGSNVYCCKKNVFCVHLCCDVLALMSYRTEMQYLLSQYEIWWINPLI